MTPDTVFKDKTETVPGVRTLAGSSITPTRILESAPPSAKDMEAHFNKLFTDRPKVEAFYTMAKHLCRMTKSKNDAKQQLETVLELYFTSLKIQYPNDITILDEIKKTLEPTIKLIDNYVKSGNMSNEYFYAGVCAFALSLL